MLTYTSGPGLDFIVAAYDEALARHAGDEKREEGRTYTVGVFCSCPATRLCWHIEATAIYGRAVRLTRYDDWAAKMANKAADELVAELYA